MARRARGKRSTGPPGAKRKKKEGRTQEAPKHVERKHTHTQTQPKLRSKSNQTSLGNGSLTKSMLGRPTRTDQETTEASRARSQTKTNRRKSENSDSDRRAEREATATDAKPPRERQSDEPTRCDDEAQPRAKPTVTGNRVGQQKHVGAVGRGSACGTQGPRVAERLRVPAARRQPTGSTACGRFWWQPPERGPATAPPTLPACGG